MSQASLDALQSALAGEHAAVYVFSTLAAQTSQTASSALYDDLLASYTAHRDARDHVVARVNALRGEPAAAAPSYRLPNAMTSPDLVRRGALVTEQRMTDVYGTLVAGTVAEDREWAIRSMDESAISQLRFRGRPEIFPGTDGLGGRG